MEFTIKKARIKLSPEKLKDVKSQWTIINHPSPKNLENFNRILAAAQLRTYQSCLKRK